jgi:hypothetical protein
MFNMSGRKRWFFSDRLGFLRFFSDRLGSQFTFLRYFIFVRHLKLLKKAGMGYTPAKGGKDYSVAVPAE